MAKPLLLVLCFALVVTPDWASSTSPTGTSEPPDVQTVAPTEDETLQNEADNQENVLSQLLGDYDKVKAVSEGSDCQCKCVVRPLGRDACQRINAGASRKEDFYTVETITSGSSCKCACVAPPSALNPCEGDFRLQKLREADSQDLKLSTIIDMLEGAFYGLDLMKLHSVTTKLVGRVDRLEEKVSKNLTEENEQIKEDMEEIRTEMNKRGKENCSDNVLDSMPDIRSALQRDAAAAYAHPEYEERFLQEETVSQQINSIELLQTRPLDPPEVVKPPRPLQRQVHLRGRPASQPTVIRGITYYKAKVPEEENDIEEQQDEFFSGDNGVDLLIEDQLLRHNDLPTRATRRPAATRPRHSTAVASDLSTQTAPLSSALPQASTPAPSVADPALSASARPHSATLPTTSAFLDPTGEAVLQPSPQVPATTVAHTATQPPPAPASPAMVPGDAHMAPVPPTTVGTSLLGKDATAGQGTTPASPTLSPEEEDDIRNVIGRWSNSYKLPYSWIGTGHVVYNGAFYYNRAFTRNIIKYDLKQRFVAAWAMLHDVAYEEATPWRWQGHSDVDFAVDENGLWLIYPALDDEGFSQEVIVLSKLNAADLSTQKETTWRTGLRRNFYGNCFVICGVLYAVDSYNQRNANISYAFDTHTNTQIVPRLLFENEYSYTTQIDYNPKDRLLYAWDNGHQVTYHVIFAY
ncbi:olfactomedin-like protein 2B isoform X4 [Eulemur rufifrons]|uniref:olfactomedin-like protein 2B isoform X4 n=1 Tax=Eulemur rufifrons TaxID=859984 RepID=UPI0037447162